MAGAMLGLGASVEIVITSQNEEESAWGFTLYALAPTCTLAHPHSNNPLENVLHIESAAYHFLTRQHYDAVVVIGDTSTAYGAALAARTANLFLIHIEAGLRSNSFHEPWPENFFRIAIDHIASLNVAPTHRDEQNLFNERVDPNNVLVADNPIFHALDISLARKPNIENFYDFIVTSHRREFIEEKLALFLKDMAALASELSSRTFLIVLSRRSTHMKEELESLAPANLAISMPIPYPTFVQYLSRARLVISDSGTLQEEAYALNTPLAVMRDYTERSYYVDGTNQFMLGKYDESQYFILRRLINEAPVRAMPSTATSNGTSQLHSGLVTLARTLLAAVCLPARR